MISNIKNNDKLIRVGSIFNASIPFKLESSLGVFLCFNNELEEKCSTSKCWAKKDNISLNINKVTCNKCKTPLNQQCKGIIKKIDFESLKEIINLRPNQPTKQQVPINYANRFKIRPYLILSTKLNDLPKYDDYVWGLPIYSLKSRHLQNEDFMNELKSNKIPQLYFLDSSYPGITKESYIDLCYLNMVNKKYLINYIGFLEPNNVYEIQNRLKCILDLESFNSCDDIEMLKLQRNSLNEQLNKIKVKINTLENRC